MDLNDNQNYSVDVSLILGQIFSNKSFHFLNLINLIEHE